MRRPRGAIQITDPWWGEIHVFADQVHEQQRETHSRLLGPDGQPLRYDRPKVGFDLSPRRKPGASE